jgi:hypothetical protein
MQQVANFLPQVRRPSLPWVDQKALKRSAVPSAVLHFWVAADVDAEAPPAQRHCVMLLMLNRPSNVKAALNVAFERIVESALCPMNVRLNAY